MSKKRKQQPARLVAGAIRDVAENLDPEGTLYTNGELSPVDRKTLVNVLHDLANTILKRQDKSEAIRKAK